MTGTVNAVMTPKASALIQQIKEAEERISQMRRDLNAELLEIAYSTWGVKYGVVVKSARDQKLYKIVEVETRWIESYGSRPWLRGVANRKDGSWGERVVHIYGDWEIQP